MKKNKLPSFPANACILLRGADKGYDSFNALYMVRVLFIMAAIFSLTAAKISAISFIPSDIGNVGEMTRGTNIFYHNNSVDQLWYGTDKWAVKFDIERYTPVTDTLTMKSLKIYFPQQQGTYSLQIYNDRTQPLQTSLFERGDIAVQAGWNEITFSENDYLTDTVFWIVISYETNPDNRYLAASAKGGNNSYYWVPEQGEISGHFANMLNDNLITEFLVSISGYLHVAGTDLELTSFTLEGNIVPQGNITPTVRVRNNSRTVVDDRLALSLELINPTTEPMEFRSASRPVVLNPGEETVVRFPGTVLPAAPAQYQVTATLIYANDPYPGNNTIRYTFNTLPEKVTVNLTENFVRTQDSNSKEMLAEQQANASPDDFRLNYFFHPQDAPHFKVQSANRKDFYRIGGYPFTVVNGVKKIAGYPGDYAAQYRANLTATAGTPSFIAEAPGDQETIIYGTDMMLSLKFTLRNRDSHLLPETIANIRLFVALTEKNIPELPGNALIYLHAHTPVLSLGFRENYRFDGWELNLRTTNAIHREINDDNLVHFDIFYWVQDIRSGKIYYLNKVNLDRFTLDVEENEITAGHSNISVHPNPLRANEKLTISLDSSGNESKFIDKVGVYNIKGQLISSIRGDRESEAVFWNGRTASGLNSANGIYFLKVETLPLNNTAGSVPAPHFRKVIILNSD